MMIEAPNQPVTDEEYLEQMRQACRDSLYVFGKTACGFTKFIRPLHKDMCDFLQYNPSLRKVLLAPRDHFKSSVVQAFILWRLVRNPEERILIVGDTATTAQKKMAKLQGLIIENSVMRALFPDIIPDNVNKTQWSTEAITVPRKGAHAEPSITATGVGGARAGAHYTLIVPDDMATKEAKDQPSTMAKIIDWSDGMEALLEEPYENQIVVVGTPWAHDDVHEHLTRAWSSGKGEATKDFFSEFRRPFFDSGGEPIFSGLYADADGNNGRENAFDFAERFSRTNHYLWSANFLLDPQVEDSEFKPEDLQYYVMSPDREYILFKGDGYEEQHVQPVGDLQGFLTCDPAFKKDATASKAAINVSGVDSKGNIFILESIGVRGGTNVLIDRICEMVRRYDDILRKVGVEKVAQQQAFIDYLNKEFRRRGIYRTVEPLPPGSRKSKIERIRSLLQPYFGEKRVYLRINMVGLLDEFRKFPLSEVRDELDAMAYAANYYWGKAGAGLHSNYKEYIRRYEEQRSTANPTTGY